MASAVGNWIRKSFKRKESRDIRGDDATSNLTSVAVQVDQAVGCYNINVVTSKPVTHTFGEAFQ